jgi:hypothetical protein
MKTDEVFGINRYEGWTANKRQVYGIRGIGDTYNQFWKNFKKFKPIYEYDDFPWSYVALNEEDEKIFLQEYSAFISDVEDDSSPYDSILDVPPKQPASEEEKLLESILMEEIQKEINKEVIRTINIQATK